jgi:VanZ family protein
MSEPWASRSSHAWKNEVAGLLERRAMPSGAASIRPSTHVLMGTALVYWVALIVALHWPMELGPDQGLLAIDKLVHMMLYGGLSLVLIALFDRLAADGAWAATAQKRGSLTLLAIALQGMSDEITQPLTGRTCDLFDWGFDLFGAAVALTVYRLVRRRISARQARGE